MIDFIPPLNPCAFMHDNPAVLYGSQNTQALPTTFRVPCLHQMAGDSASDSDDPVLWTPPPRPIMAAEPNWLNPYLGPTCSSPASYCGGTSWRSWLSPQPSLSSNPHTPKLGLHTRGLACSIDTAKAIARAAEAAAKVSKRATYALRAAAAASGGPVAHNEDGRLACAAPGGTGASAKRSHASTQKVPAKRQFFNGSTSTRAAAF